MNTRKLVLPASVSAVLALTGALSIGLPATAGAVTAPSGPPGYHVAFGQVLTVAAGTQARNTVHCPNGTVPLGGGVFLNDSLAASISSSFPTANGWTGVVNNSSEEPGSLLVAVACAKKPAHYSVVMSKPVVNAPGHRTTATVSCPKSAKPLGGGGQSTGGLFVNLGASRPFNNGWRVAEANLTADFAADPAIANPTVKAFVVCGTVAGYRLVTQKPSTVLPDSQATVTANCQNSVVLGGGASVNTNSIGVDLNTTAPIDPTAAIAQHGSARPPFGWLSVINNNTSDAVTSSPFAICAGG